MITGNWNKGTVIKYICDPFNKLGSKDFFWGTAPAQFAAYSML